MCADAFQSSIHNASAEEESFIAQACAEIEEDSDGKYGMLLKQLQQQGLALEKTAKWVRGVIMSLVSRGRLPAHPFQCSLHRRAMRRRRRRQWTAEEDAALLFQIRQSASVNNIDWQQVLQHLQAKGMCKEVDKREARSRCHFLGVNALLATQETSNGVNGERVLRVKESPWQSLELRRESTADSRASFLTEHSATHNDTSRTEEYLAHVHPTEEDQARSQPITGLAAQRDSSINESEIAEESTNDSRPSYPSAPVEEQINSTEPLMRDLTATSRDEARIDRRLEESRHNQPKLVWRKLVRDSGDSVDDNNSESTCDDREKPPNLTVAELNETDNASSRPLPSALRFLDPHAQPPKISLTALQTETSKSIPGNLVQTATQSTATSAPRGRPVGSKRARAADILSKPSRVRASEAIERVRDPLQLIEPVITPYPTFVFHANGKISRERRDIAHEPSALKDTCARFTRELLMNTMRPVQGELEAMAHELGYKCIDTTQQPMHLRLLANCPRYIWVLDSLDTALTSAQMAVCNVDFFVSENRFIDFLLLIHTASADY
jgi:hypothetical protein